MPVVALPVIGRPVGVGVLGCADIAVRRFLPALARSGNARLVAVASRDARKASGIASLYDVEATNYSDLLSSAQVELVYIPLPNHLHEEWALAALRHGKHVLCEKPLALDADSVERILTEAERRGLLVYENIMYLQHPQHGLVKHMLADGRIGAVTGLHCTFTFPGPANGNYRLDPLQGGGAFHDLNRYPLSAARFFLKGDIDRIDRSEIYRRDGLDMAMAGEARTTADERFSFDIAFGKRYRSCYEIIGTAGMLRLERAFTTPPEHEAHLEIRSNEGIETVRLPAHDHFRLTMEHVAALIADGDYSPEHRHARSLAQVADRFLQQADLHKEPLP